LVTPTHLITHSKGWEAHIYIAESLQDQLESSSSYQRENAQHSVSIAFREACKKKFPSFGLQYVEFADLRLTPLHTEPEPGDDLVWTGREWLPTSVFGDVPDEDDDGCDECPRCEEGYHEQCRNRNCPQARR